MQLQPDFRELLRLFEAKGVEYLLIGGVAVAMHGYPRNTIDLDLAVAPTVANARRIVSALEEFGFTPSSLTTDLFTEQNSLVRIGYPPVRVEILNYLKGLDFEAAFSNRDERDFDGVKVNLISRRDLIINKTSVGRHKDLADVEELEKMAD